MGEQHCGDAEHAWGVGECAVCDAVELAESLREVVNDVCTCGGGGPGDGCPACELWHRVRHLVDGRQEGGGMGEESIQHPQGQPLRTCRGCGFGRACTERKSDSDYCCHCDMCEACKEASGC
jgi:hypothetical protein